MKHRKLSTLLKLAFLFALLIALGDYFNAFEGILDGVAQRYASEQGVSDGFVDTIGRENPTMPAGSVQAINLVGIGDGTLQPVSLEGNYMPTSSVQAINLITTMNDIDGESMPISPPSPLTPLNTKPDSQKE
jgi:hypothetical protein